MDIINSNNIKFSLDDTLEKVVDKLDKLIPEQCYQLQWTQEDNIHYAGMRQAVLVLNSRLREAQEENEHGGNNHV